VRAGDCATARLAACAISLFGPTTNDSKVLRGFSPSALPLFFASRAISGSGSITSMAFDSFSEAAAVASEGIANFTVRGAPKAVTIADCRAGM
jgi:hypothetical protein